MRSVLFSATDPQGRPVTDRIEADSTHRAREKLRSEGYRDIIFHSQARETDADEALSATAELKARRLGGSWKLLWFVLRGNALLLVPLLLWTGWALLQGPPFSWGDWVGMSLCLGLLAFLLLSALPALLYQRLLAAHAWADWARVRRLVRRLRALPRSLAGGLPSDELDFRLAYAEAATRGLQPALERVEPHRPEDADALAVFEGRLAGVHRCADDIPGMLRCQQRAAELAEDSEPFLIDLALSQLRYAGKADEAQRLLASVDLELLPDFAATHVGYLRGLLALESNEPQAARNWFLQALDDAARYAGNPVLQTTLAELLAYLAIALGRLGDRRHGQRCLDRARPLLQAWGETDLLASADEALGGS